MSLLIVNLINLAFNTEPVMKKETTTSHKQVYTCTHFTYKKSSLLNNYCLFVERKNSSSLCCSTWKC